MLIISTEASANFLIGYTIGRSSTQCSCTDEDYKIRELERENQRLKKELEKLQSKEERGVERQNQLSG